MSVQADFSLARQEDGVLIISMTPVIPIGGQNYQFQVTKRFGGTSGLITKSMHSGFYNVSGMNIVNSGQGIMRVNINEVDTSGREWGNYSFNVQRLDSGNRTVVSEGYLVILP